MGSFVFKLVARAIVLDAIQRGANNTELQIEEDVVCWLWSKEFTRRHVALRIWG